MIFSSTRPLGALAVALIVFGTLTLYTYAARRHVEPPSGVANAHDETTDVEITLTSTTRLGNEEFALGATYALRIFIDGQPLQSEESLDAHQPLVLHHALATGSEHRLLVEAIPETSGEQATALRIAITSKNQPIVEHVGWSEQGQVISEELVFRVPSEEHSH